MKQILVLSAFLIAVILGAPAAVGDCGKCGKAAQAAAASAECPGMKEGAPCPHCTGAKEGKEQCCKECAKAHARHRHRKGGDPAATFLLDHAKPLELTEAQVGALERLAKKQEENEVKLRARKATAREELSRLLAEKQPNRRKIEAAAKELGQLKGEWMAADILASFDARALLTDAQRTKLDEMRSAPEAGEAKEEKPAKKEAGGTKK